MNDKQLEDYITFLKNQGRAESTVKSRRFILRYFHRKIGEEFNDPNKVLDFIDGSKDESKDEAKGKDEAKAYGTHGPLPEKHGTLSETTKQLRFIVLKRYYQWLKSQCYIVENIFDTRIPERRKFKLLPSKICSVKDIGIILNNSVYLNRESNNNQSSVLRKNPFLKQRDALLLELCYAASLRRSEAIRLKVSDFDPDLQSLYIRKTKNHRSRLIPVGEYVSNLLLDYLKILRTKDFMKNKTDEEALLFPSMQGHELNPNHVTNIAKAVKDASKVKSEFSSHSLRKSSASHMLRAGASIATIQALLGHNCLSSSEVYTKLHPKHLIKFHKAFHPFEREKGMVMPKLELPEFIAGKRRFPR